MHTKTSNQPLTHWVQLLFIFTLPGAVQGLAFYLIADSSHSMWPDWRLFALWFLAIAPTCVFLISLPEDRIRSVGVSVLLALILSGLFYFDAREALGVRAEGVSAGRLVAVAIICSMIVIFTVLPFYRTRWQQELPFSHYASLFEFAWNQTVCVLVGLAFTALVAALMGLTVALFNSIGIAMDKWLFDTPLMGAWVGGAFATAIGVTRQSDAVVLGARELLLALLRILLLLMLPICLVFVGLVGVIGVDKMDTGLSIALIMLAAAVVAITLVSARIGDAREQLAGFQQVLMRGMAIVVLPLSLLAVHALWFRVEQHGWTGHRVLAAVIVALCALYGLGYLLAALRKPLVWIPRVNRWMAGVCTILALLLMTPLLDPDRIGVRDQMARFLDGRTSPEELDLGYLKFHSGKVGIDALAVLSAMPEAQQPPLSDRLDRLANVHDRYQLEYEGVLREELTPLMKAVADGTLRLLKEESSGWARLMTKSNDTDDIIGHLLNWGFYELGELCLRQAQDCAFIASDAESDLFAIRVSDTQMTFYLLPVDRFFDSPMEDGDTDPAQSMQPPSMPPSFYSKQPVQFDSTIAAVDIDAWFASLDKGQVPTQIVEMPSFMIGTFGLLRSRTVAR